MKERFIHFWNSIKAPLNVQNNPELEHSFTGRIVSALTFIIVILCLALWITVFLLLKDLLFIKTLSGNILTNLTCLIFFGGLVIAMFIGALAGNSLRRTFWKILIERKKK